MNETAATAQRSAIMRAVHSRDTGPEITLRQALWRVGLRYRLNLRIAATRPDIVFLRARVAVFVDGCFWHGCPVHFRVPKTNSAFWNEKVLRNQDRDARDTLRLQAKGWTVLRIWQCDIKKDVTRGVATIHSAVRGQLNTGE
jgi:DNA mismatch endonuclease (patch repair protein)